MKATLTTPPPPRSTPATRAANTSHNPYTPPFTIIVDCHEQAPFFFKGMREKSNRSYRPRNVRTVRQELRTGDYSLVGYTDQVTIERKSLADLFASLGGKNGTRRNNFKAEHERMTRMKTEYKWFGRFAHVVIEANRPDVWLNTPEYSGLSPNAVLGYELSWYRKFGVRWWWAGGRREAEELTYDLLEDAYKIIQREKRAIEAEIRNARIEVLKGSK